MLKVVVTGGAGYVGSHACQALAARRFVPVTVDDLSMGHREAVQWGPLHVGNAADEGFLAEVFQEHQPAAVLHFAASTFVGESVKDPIRYYRNNVGTTLSLLNVMHRFNVDKFIFSSTCAIYGTPRILPLAEDHPKDPLSPYGSSKLMVEQILDSVDHAFGVRSVALRYFNAAGADPAAAIGEDHEPETHLIPIVLQVALGQRDALMIFGEDYDTPDGTAIRDYVHVCDLADAHVRALQWLLDGGHSLRLNLGVGKGYSVREVVDLARQVTGHAIPVRVTERRPGDAQELIAESGMVQQHLGWKPERSDLRTIIEDAWRWHRRHELALEAAEAAAG